MTDPTDFLEIARQIDAFIKPEAEGRQARTRERILRAATELFVAYGYRKTSIEDIAGAARVAKGTVYLYYDNKAELLLHAIALQKRQYLTELAPAFDRSRAPQDRLGEMIRLGIVLSRRMPLVQRSTSGDHEIEEVLLEVDARTIVRINEMQVAYVVGLLDAATGGEWPRDLVEKRAEVLIDLMFALATGGRLVHEGMPLEEYAGVVAGVIAHGIVEPPA